MTYIIHYSYRDPNCDNYSEKVESERCETAEQVQKFVDYTAASNKEPRYHESYTTITLIENVGDIINVTHQFHPNQSAVEAIIAQTKKEKEEREKQRQQEATEQRREKYLILKKEFDNAENKL